MYEYDAQGRNTVIITQLWENGAWVNHERSEDILNSEGLITETVVQVWVGGSWQNDTRYLYAYGGSLVSEKAQPLPKSFCLRVFPNPFNPETTIRLEIRETDRIVIQIMDIQGRVVRTWEASSFSAGTHAIRWDGRDDFGHDLPSGLYLIRASGFRNRALGRCLLVR